MPVSGKSEPRFLCVRNMQQGQFDYATVRRFLYPIRARSVQMKSRPLLYDICVDCNKKLLCSQVRYGVSI